MLVLRSWSSQMSFAILRLEKLKTFADVGGSLSHNYRNRETLNADPQLSHLNEHDQQTHAICMSAIRDRIPENRRKDAVLCIEHLVTASPEWSGWGTEKEAEFFEKSKKWLEEKYGKKNVISTTIHRDESTPHMVAYIVPLDEETGRLNAKKFIGGTRHVLSKMQTDFAKEVKELGLERGLEGSKAKHTRIKDYYAEINSAVKKVLPEIQLTRLEKQPKTPMLTRNEVHGEAVIDAVFEHIAPQLEQYEQETGAEFSALTAKLNSEKNKSKKLEKQVSDLVEVSQSLKNVISEYDKEFEVFQYLRIKSEEKYQDLKKHTQTQIDAELQKENDRLSFTVTPKTEVEKKVENAFKNMNQSQGPAVDLGAQSKKEKDKGNDLSIM